MPRPPPLRWTCILQRRLRLGDFLRLDGIRVLSRRRGRLEGPGSSGSTMSTAEPDASGAFSALSRKVGTGTGRTEN